MLHNNVQCVPSTYVEETRRTWKKLKTCLKGICHQLCDFRIYLWSLTNIWQLADKYWIDIRTKDIWTRRWLWCLMQTYGRAPAGGDAEEIFWRITIFQTFPVQGRRGIEACDRAVTRLFPTKTKTTPHIFQETTYLVESYLWPCGIQICLLPGFGFGRRGPNCISLILWSVFVCAAAIRDLLPIFS